MYTRIKEQNNATLFNKSVAKGLFQGFKGREMTGKWLIELFWSRNQYESSGGIFES